MEEPTLAELRRRIDEVDAQILKLLEERMRICREISRLKRRLNLPVEDRERERRVLARAGVYKEVFKEIISTCKKAQEEVMRDRV